MSAEPSPQRDPEAVSKFIERFASTLVNSGVPRMPARVFAAVLAADSGRLTAAELADILQVSPAAVSGAVRYLAQVSMVDREREPGSRRDHVVVRDDAWYEMLMRRDQALKQWEDSLRDGVDALGEHTPGGARVAETLAFLEFVHTELPSMLTKWREHREKLRAARGFITQPP
ncbi:MAG TPA: MarR family transcriptional regulator [Streptosporangiaceae bacterium]|jgi:DNA-binding transcriptional regulator GbsR (MarR family)